MMKKIALFACAALFLCSCSQPEAPNHPGRHMEPTQGFAGGGHCAVGHDMQDSCDGQMPRDVRRPRINKGSQGSSMSGKWTEQ